MKNLSFFLLVLLFSITLNAQNNALHFDGDNDYVSLTTPLLPIATANDAWTVEMKFQTVTADHDVLFSQYISTNSDRSTIDIKYGKVVYWKSSGGEIVKSPNYYNDDLWHHIAVVKEGSSTNQVLLYVDGVLVDSGTDSNLMANVNAEIGRIDNSSDYRNFPGIIDELRIWNTARTQAEISANKDIELVGTETGLTAYYNFNQGVANANNAGITTLTDVTSNANNGTLHNFSLSGNTSNWVRFIQNTVCEAATNITISNSLQTINFEDIAFSLITNEILCPDENPQNYYSLWYDFTLAENGDVQITNASTYDGFELYNACSDTSLDCFTGSNGTFTNLSAGINYRLRVFRTQANSQQSGTSFQIMFQESLSVSNDLLSNSIEIYPNPASSIINIDSKIDINIIELFDVLGKKILTTNQTAININAIQSGIYFLKINTNQGHLIKRVVVK